MGDVGAAGENGAEFTGVSPRIDAPDPGPRQRRYLHVADQRVPGPFVRFTEPQQVLGEFLARAQAGVHDVDLACRAGHQPPRDVRDLHLLAHVEYEDFAVAPDDSGLENELNRFVSDHEVPADLGMRHRTGPPAATWALSAVSTDPRLPRTLPKRTLR